MGSLLLGFQLSRKNLPRFTFDFLLKSAHKFITTKNIPQKLHENLNNFKMQDKIELLADFVQKRQQFLQ